jgi:hypothetical protein
MLLECSLPMAMAILSSNQDFKIVAFLDVAVVEPPGSCTIYYDPALRDDASMKEEVELLVPSVQSMTAIFGAPFVREILNRPYRFKVLGNYKNIIREVTKAARSNCLAKYVWVLDEATEEREYHNRLFDRLKRIFGNKTDTKVNFDGLFPAMFKHFAHKGVGDFFKSEIPGMVVIAHRLDLDSPSKAEVLYRFLDRFRKSKGRIVQSKSLGPFQWDNADEFISLLDLLALIASEAETIDSEVEGAMKTTGIERRLQVHRDFFDVVFKVDPDPARRRKALINFCGVLRYELDRTLQAARGQSEMEAKARNLIEMGNKAETASENTSKALETLETSKSPHDMKRVFDSEFEKITSICHEARDIERSLRAAFGAVQSLAGHGVAILDKREGALTPQ